MRPDLHWDPDVLDRAAARLRELAATLRDDARAATDGDHAGAATIDEHGAAARRIADELDSLAGSAARSAAAARDVDDVTALAFRATVHRGEGDPV
ncbi:hypothetical protein [Pseudonocardia parietis]|uniref:PE family protein n=1 Tax=Pseudonocardia parietis TaxID=570936 RepID=A0ABS4VPI1_9PSEU|nr:hypothetical protein [Pseudonocardia parietis]MBP2365833.1 hypothetical protein [Pseudonocardia parietis]